MSGMKICRKCHLEKPLSEFTITDAAKGWLKARCKECENARVREYYATNEGYREKTKQRTRVWFADPANREASGKIQRKSALKSKYGLSLEQYNALLIAQDNKCALCSATEVGNSQWPTGHFYVDHCHETGKVRGLVCHKCNTAVGQYEWLQRSVGLDAVADYLTRPTPVIQELKPSPPEFRHVDVLPPPRPKKVLGVCSVEGCDRAEHQMTYCQMHYARFNRTGSVGDAQSHTERRGARGSTNPKSKLTEEDVRAIRASSERGIRLAEKYGVTAALISAIRTRKQWKHVA